MEKKVQPCKTFGNLSHSENSHLLNPIQTLFNYIIIFVISFTLCSTHHSLSNSCWQDCMFKADSDAGRELKRRGHKVRERERKGQWRVQFQVESACAVFCQQEWGNRLTQKRGDRGREKGERWGWRGRTKGSGCWVTKRAKRGKVCVLVEVCTCVCCCQHDSHSDTIRVMGICTSATHPSSNLNF